MIFKNMFFDDYEIDKKFIQLQNDDATHIAIVPFERATHYKTHYELQDVDALIDLEDLSAWQEEIINEALNCLEYVGGAYVKRDKEILTVFEIVTK